MKKRSIFAFAIFALLLSLPLMSAQENISLTNVQLPQSTNEIKEKTNQWIAKPLVFPLEVQKILAALFHLEGEITLSKAIIMILILLIFMLAFMNILELFSMFSPATAKVIGALLAMILSIAGFVNGLASFFLDKAAGIAYFAGWSAGALGMLVLVFIIIMFAISRLMRMLREYQLLRIARKQGIEAGADLAIVKWIKETYTKIGSKFKPST